MTYTGFYIEDLAQLPYEYDIEDLGPLALNKHYDIMKTT